MKLINIIGANATGKSTRVSTFIRFLDSKEQPTLVFKNCRNGYKEIGRIYGDYFFLGRFNSKGVWVGLDTSDFSTQQSKLNLYKEIKLEYPEIQFFIQEGYFNNSSKTLTKELLSKYGVDSYKYYFFIYDDIQDYISRCSNRTGQEKDFQWATKSAGWKANLNFSVVFEFYKNLNEDGCSLKKVKFDEPLDFFVREFFNQEFEEPIQSKNIKENFDLDDWI